MIRRPSRFRRLLPKGAAMTLVDLLLKQAARHQYLSPIAEVGDCRPAMHFLGRAAIFAAQAIRHYERYKTRQLAIHWDRGCRALIRAGRALDAASVALCF